MILLSKDWELELRKQNAEYKGYKTHYIEGGLERRIKAIKKEISQGHCIITDTLYTDTILLYKGLLK
jgi:hypothetical protein